MTDMKNNIIINKGIKITYLTLVWMFRASLAIIEPWPLEPIPAAAIGQLIGSVTLALSMLIVTAYFWNKRKTYKNVAGIKRSIQ